MANELFCLKWNNYTSNIITELDSLRTDGDLVDVTILCDGRKITAHKVILSACSSYFRTIFRENPCQHPVVILKDINYEDIEAVLCFVYQGTVYISKSRMDSFLKTAESLQIKGLAGASNMMGDNEENRNISSEETSKIVKRTKPVPPLASVSTNVPAATSSIPRNSPINNNTPLNKRRKLFPNSNQVEDSLEDDSHHMSTIKIQNEDSRSLDSSANRQDRHSSSVGGIDKDSIDQDDESNTYNNTAYSSTGEVEDDNQMQYTDDNEDDDDDEGETSDSISQTNSISTQSSGQAVQKPPRGSSRDIKEESPAETFTNSNLNIHIAMENPPAPVIQPPLPLGDMIKTETISPTNSPFYSANNTLPTGSPGIEPSRTPAKKIVPSATDNFTQGSPADLNRGQQSFTEEELPAGKFTSPSFQFFLLCTIWTNNK
uniref:Broad-complex core protein isoform 6 n=1 Tax=Cacopsylla melanoneura TaxID=428564 RepID=A0A8D9EIU6_9HEMI